MDIWSNNGSGGKFELLRTIEGVTSQANAAADARGLLPWFVKVSLSTVSSAWASMSVHETALTNQTFFDDTFAVYKFNHSRCLLLSWYTSVVSSVIIVKLSANLIFFYNFLKHKTSHEMGKVILCSIGKIGTVPLFKWVLLIVTSEWHSTLCKDFY